MLLIIGFLGCVYLLVKGFELWGQRATNNAFKTGAIIAWVGAVVFFFALNGQASEAESLLNPSASTSSFGGAYSNDTMAIDAADTMALDASEPLLNEAAK
jgi:hypothetical protein